MGETCSNCCATAEEGKGEINDVDNDKKLERPNQQKYITTTSTSK